MRGNDDLAMVAFIPLLICHIFFTTWNFEISLDNQDSPTSGSTNGTLFFAGISNFKL